MENQRPYTCARPPADPHKPEVIDGQAAAAWFVLPIRVLPNDGRTATAPASK